MIPHVGTYIVHYDLKEAGGGGGGGGGGGEREREKERG